MGQENQKMDKVLEVIFENPEKSLNIRDISKYANVPRSTVHRYLRTLQRLNIIDKNNKFVINSYTKFLKSAHIVQKLFTSGLLDYLEENLLPSAIVLFGSARKGEYAKESDIDLFIETTKHAPLELSRFEKKIKHKLQLFIESDINKMPAELLNNVINGIKLAGYIKVK